MKTKEKLMKAFTVGIITSSSLWFLLMALAIAGGFHEEELGIPTAVRSGVSITLITIFCISLLGMLLMAYTAEVEGMGRDLRILTGENDFLDIRSLGDRYLSAWVHAVLFIILSALMLALTLLINKHTQFACLPEYLGYVLTYVLISGMFLACYRIISIRLDDRRIGKMIGKKVINLRDTKMEELCKKLTKKLKDTEDTRNLLEDTLRYERKARKEEVTVASCFLVKNGGYLEVESCKQGVAYFGSHLATITLSDGTVFHRARGDKYPEDFNALTAYADETCLDQINDITMAREILEKFGRHKELKTREEAAKAFLQECERRPSFQLSSQVRNFLCQVAGKKKQRSASKGKGGKK